MKNIRLITLTIISIIFFAASNNGFAQKQKKVKTIKIKTSVVCGDCKIRVEENLAYEKGVKTIEVDLKTKIVTIKYNPKKNQSGKTTACHIKNWL